MVLVVVAMAKWLSHQFADKTFAQEPHLKFEVNICFCEFAVLETNAKTHVSSQLQFHRLIVTSHSNPTVNAPLPPCSFSYYSYFSSFVIPSALSLLPSSCCPRLLSLLLFLMCPLSSTLRPRLFIFSLFGCFYFYVSVAKLSALAEYRNAGTATNLLTNGTIMLTLKYQTSMKNTNKIMSEKEILMKRCCVLCLPIVAVYTYE